MEKLPRARWTPPSEEEVKEVIAGWQGSVSEGPLAPDGNGNEPVGPQHASNLDAGPERAMSLNPFDCVSISVPPTTACSRGLSTKQAVAKGETIYMDNRPLVAMQFEFSK
eukprot:GHVT01081459.1.p1 GENE.GHVT01081459.1~~GHVT01081459.1.p1  ORF type:complete len:110 (-),score=15.88 GHVT01081459.1:329-658(-)